MRPVIQRDEPVLVHHLLNDRDEAGTLNDLEEVVVRCGIIGRSREMQRMRNANASGPASARLAAACSARLRCPSGVNGGIFPSGGSTMIDVRRLGRTVVARSRQNSL